MLEPAEDYSPGLPNFFLEQQTKVATNIHNVDKLQNTPNGHKIFQMDRKYANIFCSKALQNVPKLRFLV
jgi:hypothetical protein